jgi:hypothetical protein
MSRYNIINKFLFVIIFIIIISSFTVNGKNNPAPVKGITPEE